MSTSTSPSMDFAAAAPPAAGDRFALRPLSTGEILDRTFQLYRGRFWLFAGISAFVPALGTLSAIVQTAVLHHKGAQSALALGRYAAAVLILFSSMLVFLLYGVTHAATTWAVSAIYLGRTASMATAFRAIRPHWFRYTMIPLAQMWSAFWPPILLFSALVAVTAGVGGRGSATTIVAALWFFLLFGLIYGVWAYIRVLLATPAAVVEDLRTRPAIRRSKMLLRDRKVRIFLLLLLLLALYMVAGTVEAPFNFMIVRAHGAKLITWTSIVLAIQFVAGTFLAPISAIALCLFYFDERVRREGFDIEWLLSGQTPTSPTSAPATDRPDLLRPDSPLPAPPLPE